METKKKKSWKELFLPLVPILEKLTDQPELILAILEDRIKIIKK